MLIVNIGTPEKIIIFYDSKYWDSEKINCFIVSQKQTVYTVRGGGRGGRGMGGGGVSLINSHLAKKKKLFFA